jgi:hypothetical protein
VSPQRWISPRVLLLEKTLPETPNPPGSEDIDIPTGAISNPTSPSAADSRRDAAHQSPRPDPTVHQDASPISPKSFGLRAHGGPQPGEGSSMPRLEKQPQQYLSVAESLWGNLDFIQAGFHIGRYVSASVNTQTEQEQIKALYSSMKTTSELKDVSFYVPLYLLTLTFCDTPFRERGNEASIRVPRMFKSHAWQQLINRCNVINKRVIFLT